MLLTRQWIGLAALIAGISSVGPASRDAAAQAASTTLGEQTVEGIRDHIDEAEDLVDRMLTWRHALTAVQRTDERVIPPTAPANTLMAVDRSEIERISALLSAAAAMLPRAGTQATGPRGDLRAHLEKAQEIAREMLPGAGPTPVGTTGGGRGIVTVDRAALQRLDVELDAIEAVAPRRLKQLKEQQ